MPYPEYPYPPGLFAAFQSRFEIYPCRAYEADGFFYLRFGRPYELNLGRELPVGEKDEQAAQIIMKNIARLLPLHLKGEFVEEA